MVTHTESRSTEQAPTRMVGRLKKMVRQALYGDDTVHSVRVYPESVQYALHEGAALVNKPEIEALIDYGFLPEATYLIAKAFENDPTHQEHFLRALTEVYTHYDEAQHIELLWQTLSALPTELNIKAGKLAQLSRVDNDFWQEKFRELAWECYEADPQSVPILAAYAVILGYRHFVEAYSQHDNPAHLLLLVPEWIKDGQNPECGYVITINDGIAVTLFSKQQARTFLPNADRAWFIDDTIKTGTSAGTIRSFWKAYTGFDIPEDRIRALTDLRRTQSPPT